MFKPFFLSGSKSTDLDSRPAVTHLLPPCPNSPNCIRISKQITQKSDILWEKVMTVLQRMDPAEMNTERSGYRIDAVFRVFLFKDDFTLKLEAKGNGSIIHIRSASREGYSDLGVNRRRVKRFLRLLDTNV